MITGRLWKWKGVLSGAGLSAIIELLQLISQRGLFEFDDIINNTLGTVIGVTVYLLIATLLKKRGKQ